LWLAENQAFYLQQSHVVATDANQIGFSDHNHRHHDNCHYRGCSPKRHVPFQPTAINKHVGF